MTGTKTQPRPARATACADFAGLQPSRLLRLLADMLLIRRFEERTMQAYQRAKIGGFCHVHIGQEAVAVGSIAATRPNDPIITAHRDHGHALARGMSPNACMAEMFGKATGCAKGKGGSLHMFDREHANFGGHAIVGAQNPLGCGLAWAIGHQTRDDLAIFAVGPTALGRIAASSKQCRDSVVNTLFRPIFGKLI